MSRYRLPIVAAATAFALVAAGAAQSATPKLVGTVGPGFTISLKGASGQSVKSLNRGVYLIQVADKASIHNFHLSGPSLDKKTSVGGTGTTRWTLRLKPGKYHFQCDIHPSTMKGDFKVV